MHGIANYASWNRSRTDGSMDYPDYVRVYLVRNTIIVIIAVANTSLILSIQYRVFRCIFIE